MPILDIFLKSQKFWINPKLNKRNTFNSSFDLTREGEIWTIFHFTEYQFCWKYSENCHFRIYSFENFPNINFSKILLTSAQETLTIWIINDFLNSMNDRFLSQIRMWELNETAKSTFFTISWFFQKHIPNIECQEWVIFDVWPELKLQKLLNISAFQNWKVTLFQ